MLVVSMVHALIQRVVAALDRRTEAPTMTVRVNGRSDEYFRWRDAHPGATTAGDDATIVHFWSHLRIGPAHPAGRMTSIR